MHISTAGNVGIGTTGPTYGLYVNGPSLTGGSVYITNKRGGYIPLAIDVAEGDYQGVLIQHKVGSGGGGCGGSGCSGFKFDDQRTNTFSGVYGPSFYINRSGAFAISNVFQVDTHGATGLAVDNGGNVGIGTISPLQRLQVAGGGAEFSSSLAVNSTATTNMYGTRSIASALALSTSGWSTWTGAGTCSVATDTTYSFEGQGTTVKVISTGSSECWVDPEPSPAVTTNTQYSTTFIVRNATGTTPGTIHFTYDNEECSPTWEAYGSGWYKGTCTRTTDGTPSNGWDGMNIHTGTDLWIARAQIEQQSTVTPFTAWSRTSPSVNLSTPLEVNTTSIVIFTAATSASGRR